MFWTWQCFILGFLVFSFLVYSVYQNPKSTHHPLFLAIFPDLEMLQFWSKRYICQVWKLYLYFGHVRNVGQYLYLSVFSKQRKCATLCCIDILVKTVFFCTVWRLKTLILWRKLVQNFLIFVSLFCPNNSTTGSIKSSITLKRLIVENWPIPHWIAF